MHQLDHSFNIKFVEYLAQQSGQTAGELLEGLVTSYFGDTYKGWLQAHKQLLTQNMQIDNPAQDVNDIEPILAYVVQTVTKFLPTTLGSSLIVWDRDIDKFTMNFTTIPGQDAYTAMKGIRRDTGVTNWVLQNKQPYIVPRIEDDSFGANAMLIEAGAQSYIGVPVLTDDRIWGVLYGVNRYYHDFSERDIQFMFDLAQIAGVSLSKAKLSQYLLDANRDLNAFAHTVAHDLKKPLSDVNNTLQAMALEPSPSTELYTQYMQEVTIQAFEIIEELLVLAELRNSDEISYAPVNMAHILADVQLRLKALIDKSNAQINLPETWPDLLSHAPWIKAIWSNLLSNAVKYGGQPPIVELGFDYPDPSHIRYWIRDNGPGISQEAQKQLFVTRTRLGRSDAIEGHGFGLGIVHKIVQKLQGEVGVESKVGSGSLFFFILPIEQ